MEIMIDARAAAESAIQQLLGRKDKLKLKGLEIRTLSSFLRYAEKKDERLSKEEKELICDQAILILEQFYAHMPFKRARYATDPVQRLRLTKAEIGDLDEQSFHAAIIRTFTELRDVHTIYSLPEPFRGHTAFLPFFVESYETQNGQRRFVVTEILDGFDPDPGYFTRYVEITGWSGVPIGKAVDQLARSIPGGNKATRVIRGTMRLTVRTMTNVLPPPEELVFVHYKPIHLKEKNVAERIIAVPWYVGKGLKRIPRKKVSTTESSAVCVQLAELANFRKVLYPAPKLAKTKTSADERNAYDTLFPDMFEVHHTFEISDDGKLPWSDILTSSPSEGQLRKSFGYIRIRNFDPELGEIFGEFRRILQWFDDHVHAAHGLIIDIRSNPGGAIVDAERCLQLLTPNHIEPALFHFPNTEAIQRVLSTFVSRETIFATLDLLAKSDKHSIVAAKPVFEKWVKGVLGGVASGSVLTDGRPLTDPELANDTGQLYQGPVLLLTDAGSYSAADIFAGGFQDHDIGLIVGVDDNTGGGGAKRWEHGVELDAVRALTGFPITLLPNGASFSMAIQRSTRVKNQTGEPVEDLGVKCDVRHRLSLTDLQTGSSELLHFACSKLSEQVVYRLKIKSAEVVRSGGIKVTIKGTPNLRRIVCSIQGQPQLVVPLALNDVAEKSEFTKTFTVPFHVLQNLSFPFDLSVQGYGWAIHRGQHAKKLQLMVTARQRINGK